MRKAAIELFLLIGFLSISIHPIGSVQAQSGLGLHLSNPDLSQFPKVTLYLDVYDQLGNFASDLTLRNVRLMEDGQERIVNETFLTQPGLDAIVAINLSSTLSNRSATGATRFQDLNSVLLNWINYLPVTTEQDRYSLTANEGILIERQKERASFIKALQSYQPNLFNLKPNLASLQAALDIAGKGSPIQNGKQAIFYLTALPLDSELEKIPKLIQQAAQLKTPVFVWLLAADASENSASAAALSDLAQKTGGKFFLYGESKKAPNPEEYFISLRYSYRVRYTSAIKQSGTHRVSVQVQRGDQTANSSEVSFLINLNVPVPSLVNLPLQITRNWMNDAQNNLLLQPELIILKMEVDFPDGFPRQLKYSRLIVDGQVTILNSKPPFEFFGWVLKNYRNNGDHTLQVEVEDILGYKGKSIAITIPITVAPRATNFFGQLVVFLSSGGWLIPAGLLLAGAGYLVYRQKNSLVALLVKKRIEKEMTTYDPLTQPVIVGGGDVVESNQKLMESQAIEEKKNTAEPPRLVWAGSQPAPQGLEVILLTQTEMLVGKDRKQCQVLLKLPSVEKIHALINLSADGHVRIANRSQKKGTWVNFAPVSSVGAILHSGDLIHFGKVSFRYEIGKPSSPVKDEENL